MTLDKLLTLWASISSADWHGAGTSVSRAERAKLYRMCLPHSRCLIIINYVLWMTSHHEVMFPGVTKNVHISKLQF